MAQVDNDVLRKRAAAKLCNIRIRDVEQHGRCDLTLEHLLELVAESNGKCPGCNCRLEFGDYKSSCRYQWSPDRINRNVPHSKGNLRIICWSCNTGGLGIRKGTCKNGCHPGDLPWGSAPVPAPNPEDVPAPTFNGNRPRRRLDSAEHGLCDQPACKRPCLNETTRPEPSHASVTVCVPGLLEG